MIYTVPTKKGIGVEIWGTRGDLEYFYDTISKFWGEDCSPGIRYSEDKDNLISSFSYELRKASYGSRLTRDNDHFSFEPIPYFGFKVSWVHIFFILAVIKYNMRFANANKADVAMMLHIEYFVEKGMFDYDPVGAKLLQPYLDDAIYGGNEHLYMYMRNINVRFFELKGGKAAFRKLASLMRTATYFSDEYNDLLAFLQSEALKHNCEIGDMELNDDDGIYEIEW